VVVTDRDRDARLDDELRRLAARRSRNGSPELHAFGASDAAKTRATRAADASEA